MAKQPTGKRSTSKAVKSVRKAKRADAAGGTATGGTGVSPVRQTSQARPSSLLDTRVIYCGDCLEKLADLPDNCVDLIYIDPPFNSNRNYDARMFWGETKEKRAISGGEGEDRHAFADRMPA